MNVTMANFLRFIILGPTALYPNSGVQKHGIREQLTSSWQQLIFFCNRQTPSLIDSSQTVPMDSIVIRSLDEIYKLSRTKMGKNKDSGSVFPFFFFIGQLGRHHLFGIEI